MELKTKEPEPTLEVSVPSEKKRTKRSKMGLGHIPRDWT